MYRRSDYIAHGYNAFYCAYRPVKNPCTTRGHILGKGLGARPGAYGWLATARNARFDRSP